MVELAIVCWPWLGCWEEWEGFGGQLFWRSYVQLAGGRRYGQRGSVGPEFLLSRQSSWQGSHLTAQRQRDPGVARKALLEGRPWPSNEVGRLWGLYYVRSICGAVEGHSWQPLWTEPQCGADGSLERNGQCQRDLRTKRGPRLAVERSSHTRSPQLGYRKR